MGTKYASVAVSGYNATPPADDGTVSESNKLKWSTIKTKLPDPLKTAIESINSALATHFDKGPTALTTNTTLGTSHYNKFVQVSGSGVTLSLTDASTLGAGWFVDILNTDSANSVSLARATASDTIDAVSNDVTIYPLQAIRVFVHAAANGFRRLGGVTQQTVPTGTMWGYAGAAAPNADWLLCDGTAYSRTTYANLFAVLGTTYGAGDGSTTFNVPDRRGRVGIGAGTGTLAEAVAAASVNTTNETFDVTSNTDTWITGMPVVLTTTGGLPTGLSLATTYYVIRGSATTIKFATSLANAVAGTAINLTSQGTGTHTVTHTLTARTRGVKLGEETHASLVAEAGSHDHVERWATNIDGASVISNAKSSPNTAGSTSASTLDVVSLVNTDAADADLTTATSGSSTAHNNMPAALVQQYIIKI